MLRRAPSSLAPAASGERPVRGLRTSRREKISWGTGRACRCGAPSNKVAEENCVVISALGDRNSNMAGGDVPQGMKNRC